MRPSGNRRIDEMLASLRASGLKLTPQRLAIVRELAADETHPTAQELFERLRPAMPTMSFATVYNTLDALAAAGLCAALSLAPGPARFDPNMRAHHHAVCDRCGLVRDVPCDGAAVPCAEGSLVTPSVHDGGDPQNPGPAGHVGGFEVRAVEWIYRGLCAACAGIADDGAGRSKVGLRPVTNGGTPRKRSAAAPPRE